MSCYLTFSLVWLLMSLLVFVSEVRGYLLHNNTNTRQPAIDARIINYAYQTLSTFLSKLPGKQILKIALGVCVQYIKWHLVYVCSVSYLSCLFLCCERGQAISIDRVQERGSVFSFGPVPLCVRMSALVFCAGAPRPCAPPVSKSQTLYSGSEGGLGEGEGQGQAHYQCSAGEEAATGGGAICTPSKGSDRRSIKNSRYCEVMIRPLKVASCSLCTGGHYLARLHFDVVKLV